MIYDTPWVNLPLAGVVSEGQQRPCVEYSAFLPSTLSDDLIASCWSIVLSRWCREDRIIKRCASHLGSALGTPGLRS